MTASHRATHDHAHGHAHVRTANSRRLSFVLALVVLYMLAEVVGGIATNSLALLADAGHMLSDAAALALSLFALWIARRPPTPSHTYGFQRTEILAALINGAALVAIAIFIFSEAAHRFGNPPQVRGDLMLAIATGGLIVNLVSLAVLSSGRAENLNVRGAWLHVASDALGSIGAILAGVLIWRWGWNWADPVASVLVGLLVLWSSWSLLRETVAVLMEGAPQDLDVDEVRAALSTMPGVRSAHDLHVWTISSGVVALSAHVHCRTHTPGPLLNQLQEMLKRRFGIDHITIQLEMEGFEGCADSDVLHP